MRDKLIGLGGDEQLLMYLTGVDGTGKCRVIFTSRSFCQKFSASTQVMFEKLLCLITACKRSATSLLDGTTIYSSVHSMPKKLEMNIEKN